MSQLSLIILMHLTYVSPREYEFTLKFQNVSGAKAFYKTICFKYGARIRQHKAVKNRK